MIMKPVLFRCFSHPSNYINPKKAEKCFQHAFDDGLPTFSRFPTFLSTFGCKKATPAPWEDLSWAQVILA